MAWLLCWKYTCKWGRGSECCWHEQVGDHVKVTGGQHAGQTGMVVRADNKICTLLSDSTKQELNCFAKDLSESLDVSMGLDTCVSSHVISDNDAPTDML